jgi:hypothetical protein
MPPPRLSPLVKEERREARARRGRRDGAAGRAAARNEDVATLHPMKAIPPPFCIPAAKSDATATSPSIRMRFTSEPPVRVA